MEAQLLLEVMGSGFRSAAISWTNWNPCSAKGIYQPKGKPAHNYQTYKPSPDGAMIYVQCEK